MRPTKGSLAPSTPPNRHPTLHQAEPTEYQRLLYAPRNRELPEDERVYYTDSETSSMTSSPSGIATAQVTQSVWGPRGQWFLFFGIGLSAYMYSLDGTTTYQYLYYATSSVHKHSMSGTISTIQAIIIAVGKPLMAKLADVMGRAETFILVTVLYIIGYLLIATSHSISQIAIGEVCYALGFSGLQILQQIVIADMTTLRYRGLLTGLVSAPFIINNFVAAEILEYVLPDWRWGYGMFAVLVPASLAPLIIALFWAQYRVKQRIARRHYRPSHRKSWTRTIIDASADMDLTGLFLVAASLSLILLPLSLAPTAQQGWKTPSMPTMIIVGGLLFPVFLLYEWKVPPRPVMPMRWLARGPILGACLIGFADFVSFFLQGTYLYSYIYVTETTWNYRAITYFTALQSLALTIFGIVGGIIMWGTKRFKYMQFCGLLIRLFGVTLMLKARSPTGTTYELIACQILQGVGGGFAAIATQVSAQAAVAHVDVATVTAMVLLLSEVGNSVGSAIAAGVWALYMPKELKRHVPTTDQTLLDELFGSITDIRMYAPADPIRLGAIAAYQAVMYRLVLGAVIVAVLPPIFCLFLTKNIRLTRAQNAVDNRDLAGRRTEEVADPTTVGREGSVRLHVGSSPRTSLADSSIVGSGSISVLGSTLGASEWRIRELEVVGDCEGDGEEELFSG